MRPPPARIHRTTTAFDVPADVPQRELTAATEAAEAHARAALPSDGRVRVEGALGKATADGRRRARFDLVVSGEEADESWPPAAQEAFAERFLDVLTSKGYDARRVA